MQIAPLLFAYFGPEVQLPLISFIGAISGLVMILGRKPVRLIKRWFRAITQRSTNLVTTDADRTKDPIG